MKRTLNYLAKFGKPSQDGTLAVSPDVFVAERPTWLPPFGIAVWVNDANELFQTAEKLLNDDAALAAMSQRATQFVAAHQGATEKAMAAVTAFRW